MRILGLAFAGTATERRLEMSSFVRETLGLERMNVGSSSSRPPERSLPR